MRKSFYEIYVNYFLILKKPTLLHIHYNTGNSFFSLFLASPKKKIFCYPGWRWWRPLSEIWLVSTSISVSRSIISVHCLDRNASPIRRPQPDLNSGMFFRNLFFFSVRYFNDFTSKMKSDLYKIPAPSLSDFFSSASIFSFSFFYFCFLYCIW